MKKSSRKFPEPLRSQRDSWASQPAPRLSRRRQREKRKRGALQLHMEHRSQSFCTAGCHGEPAGGLREPKAMTCPLCPCCKSRLSSRSLLTPQGSQQRRQQLTRRYKNLKSSEAWRKMQFGGCDLSRSFAFDAPFPKGELGSPLGWWSLRILVQSSCTLRKANREKKCPGCPEVSSALNSRWLLWYHRKTIPAAAQNKALWKLQKPDLLVLESSGSSSGSCWFCLLGFTGGGVLEQFTSLSTFLSFFFFSFLPWSQSPFFFPCHEVNHHFIYSVLDIPSPPLCSNVTSIQYLPISSANWCLSFNSRSTDFWRYVRQRHVSILKRSPGFENYIFVTLGFIIHFWRNRCGLPH